MIVDASVAFKLVVDEPGSDMAVEWLKHAELVAPSLLHVEVANALWKKVQKGELSDDGEIEQRLAELGSYFRTISDVELLPRALRIALELSHPVYDCVYLALAEATDDEVLTADDRLVRSVASSPFAERVRELGR